MIKNILKNLSNPLLYYSDKSGNSVFRNYNLFKSCGCAYGMLLPKQNVGKALEYRFELDRFLKRIYIFTPIILYFIFIHFRLTIGAILLFEFLWIATVSFFRGLCSYNFSRYLVTHFGKYELVPFSPPVAKEKITEYKRIYLSKLVALLVLIVLFFIPSFILSGVMDVSVSPKHRKYSSAVKLSKVYLSVYPNSAKIYDIRAYAKYKSGDVQGAIEDYIKVLDLSGKRLSEDNIISLGNLIFLKRVESSPTEAVELFDKVVAKKRLTTLQKSKILWIKSMFRIEHHIADNVLQDYDDLLMSLKANDLDNQFFITCDRAYIMYLLENWNGAVQAYDDVILYANENPKRYSKNLPALYAERGFAKFRNDDIAGAEKDFELSGIKRENLAEYEPKFASQVFLR